MMNVKNAEKINKVIDPDLEKRDILESEIPKDVLDILLKDRTTGKNILNHGERQESQLYSY